MGLLDRPELSDASRLIVEAIIDSPIAWPSPEALGMAAGLEMGAVFCALTDLEAAGLIAPWEAGPDLFVTFTPFGASTFGVRLIEVGADEIPRWARPALEDPSPKAKGIFRHYAAFPNLPENDAGLDEIRELVEADPGLPVVGLGDRVGHLRAGDPGGDGLTFHGLLPLWPGPPVLGSPCPFCPPRLTGSAYCLYCDRSASDPDPAARRIPDPRARGARRSAEARAARKARRRARFQAA